VGHEFRRLFPVLVPDEDERRYRKLGRYILEGSKPGAAAAACYVNHRVLPLDHDHFGQLLARSVQTCERLVDRLPSLQQELAPWVRLAMPFDPDCNLLCLAFNPRGKRSLRSANAFGRRLFETIDVRPDRRCSSRNSLALHHGPLSHLGLEEPSGPARRWSSTWPRPTTTGSLPATLMNPWLQVSPGPASRAIGRPTSSSSSVVRSRHCSRRRNLPADE
jgi:hypothetical protein